MCMASKNEDVWAVASVFLLDVIRQHPYPFCLTSKDINPTKLGRQTSSFTVQSSYFVSQTLSIIAYMKLEQWNLPEFGRWVHRRAQLAGRG